MFKLKAKKSKAIIVYVFSVFNTFSHFVGCKYRTRKICRGKIETKMAKQNAKTKGFCDTSEMISIEDNKRTVRYNTRTTNVWFPNTQICECSTYICWYACTGKYINFSYKYIAVQRKTRPRPSFPHLRTPSGIFGSLIAL